MVVPAAGVRAGRRGGEPAGRLDQQCVNEGLRVVPAELTLRDVVLLGEEPGGAAGGAVPLEPAQRLKSVPLRVRGHRHEEATEGEGALRLAERTRTVLEPVDVA